MVLKKKRGVLPIISALVLLSSINGHPVEYSTILPTRTTTSTEESTQQEPHWSSKLELIVEHEKGVKDYLPSIIASVEKYPFPISKLDASLVVVSLLHAETVNYDPYAVSSAGAAGLVQFIPETAKNQFGLNAHMPEYILTARKDLQKAYSHYAKAQEHLSNLEMKSAEVEMVKFLALKKKASQAFSKYKKELLDKIKDKEGNYLSPEEIQKIDERFLPDRSIDACVNFLSHLFVIAKGDIRVAVSGYNAGEGRIRSYKGIPPFQETVLYQNNIYNKYNQLKEIVEKD